jgi:phage regulator Rha-like protein
MENKITGLSEAIVVNKIYLIRGLKVMISNDLAELYRVQTKVLNQQVKRNIGRFPDRYMFKLTIEEYKEVLRSQNVTLKRGQHSKYPPYAFTEHGILMLSSILKSERAEKVNIVIIDAFVKLRELLSTRKDVLHKLEEMEKKIIDQDDQIAQIFNYLKQFIQQKQTPPKPIGFKSGKKK